MTLEKYREVEKVANTFCKAYYAGDRIIRAETEKALIWWLKEYCSKMHKNTRFIAYTRNENLGNKKYPYIIKSVWLADLQYCKETEKCYIEGSTRILKSEIIGYLSK